MIPAMFGDAGTGSGLSGVAGVATGAAATTLTDSGAAFVTATSAAGNAGLQGHVAIATPNNSGTGFTATQQRTPTLTDTAAAIAAWLKNPYIIAALLAVAAIFVWRKYK